MWLPGNERVAGANARMPRLSAQPAALSVSRYVVCLGEGASAPALAILATAHPLQASSCLPAGAPPKPPTCTLALPHCGGIVEELTRWRGPAAADSRPLNCCL